MSREPDRAKAGSGSFLSGTGRLHIIAVEAVRTKFREIIPALLLKVSGIYAIIRKRNTYHQPSGW